MRVIAISDIHGEYDKLMSLWDKLQVTENDTVIFLGDYIDRGKQQREVIEFVLSNKNKFIFLKGNHEEMFLDYYKKHEQDWLINGGEITKEVFDEDEVLFNNFYNFSENLLDYKKLTLDNQVYIFSHAGFNPFIPFEKNSTFSFVWTRGEFLNRYNGKDIFVVGHTPTIFFETEEDEIYYAGCLCNEDYKPLFYNNIHAIDTGSYFLDGKITAFIYDTENKKVNYLQSEVI